MEDQTFTLADAAIIRTDGDPELDCTWAEWRAFNAEGFDADGFAEIESVLAAEGVYEEPAGGVAGFRLEVIWPG